MLLVPFPQEGLDTYLEGIEFADFATGLAEAVRDTRDLISEAVRPGLDMSGGSIEVETEDGDIRSLRFSDIISRET